MQIDPEEGRKVAPEETKVSYDGTYNEISEDYSLQASKKERLLGNGS